MHPIDHQELDRLIQRHAGALELFAAQWTQSAADVVQEAFIDLIESDQPPDNIPAWLFQAVRNRAINCLRTETRRRKRERARAEQSTTWFEASPDNALDAQEVSRAVDELSDAEREVVVARIWGGLKFGEIAEITGTSIATAHRRYESGIESLKKRFPLTCSMNQPVPQKTNKPT